MVDHVSAGDILTEKRQAMGWSLSYAAARIGIPEMTLYEHEHGTPVPRLRYFRILRIYNRAFFLRTRGMPRMGPKVAR